MFEHPGRQRPGAILVALAAVACLLPTPQAAAMTAEQSFAEGNRLFRDDLYWAALLRYRQAQQAGLDSPLLHYNIGVAHYRAEQHTRARVALLEAARSPDLRVLAHYNLGLNAYAAGDVDDALQWFRQARDQEENARIRRLASIAISRLQQDKREKNPPVVPPGQREQRAFANLDLYAHIGFGSDDNVFRTPNQDYVDFSNPNLPLVTPEPVSGVYMPVDLGVRYTVNSFPFEGFFGEYRLSGRYYQDKELENANEFSHELRFGSEFDRETESRRRRVYSAFSIAQHDETYFDPDDGGERIFNGEPIGERLNYVRYGPEITFRQSHERLAFGLRLKGQLWNYETTAPVPEYDHEYFRFGTNVQYRFTSTSLLRLTIDKYSRRFGDRPSFDLDGQQLVTNPSVRYDYLEAGVIARQRISRRMWFGFSYQFTDRTDRFVNYNDYTRDQYGFDLHWRIGRRMQLETGGYLRIYSYPNAFAFNNPAAGRKTLETLRGEFRATYRVTPKLSIAADAELRERTSTDTRIAYDRLRFSLGVTWQQ